MPIASHLLGSGVYCTRIFRGTFPSSQNNNAGVGDAQYPPGPAGAMGKKNTNATETLSPSPCPWPSTTSTSTTSTTNTPVRNQAVRLKSPAAKQTRAAGNAPMDGSVACSRLARAIDKLTQLRGGQRRPVLLSIRLQGRRRRSACDGDDGCKSPARCLASCNGCARRAVAKSNSVVYVCTPCTYIHTTHTRSRQGCEPRAAPVLYAPTHGLHTTR